MTKGPAVLDCRAFCTGKKGPVWYYQDRILVAEKEKKKKEKI